MKVAWLGIIGIAIALAGSVRAETWHTKQGDVEGHLSAVYGPLVVVSRTNGSTIVPMDNLGDADIGRVAEFLHTQPGNPKWKDSKSKLARALKGKLLILRDDRLVPFDPGERLEPEFYLVYFGAFWCGPCRRFSPDFVKTYQRLQTMAPNRFEVIFASWDENFSGQLSYAKEVQMPWPIVRLGSARDIREISRWEGNGIPCVVALTRDGDLLYHTYHGEKFMGPQSVLDDFELLLKATTPSYAAKKAMYRLALCEHVRSAAGKSIPPKPYLVGLDPKKYQTLEAPELKATLEIDEKGQVASASFEPRQSAVIDYELVSDAEKWLFLPAVQDGKPTALKVVIPIHIAR